MGFYRQEYWSGVPLPSPIYVTIIATILALCPLVPIKNTETEFGENRKMALSLPGKGEYVAD